MKNRPPDTTATVGAGHARPEATRPASARPAFSALTAHFPPGQFLRYLAVGAWNTLFGYAAYAALTALLTPLIPYSYMVASLLSSIVSITVAFLGYKWFVFKTKGNYLREWARCVVVYSGAIAVGLVLLPILVSVLRHYTRYQRQAPYIAGAMLTGVSVVFSFVGHSKFSFRTRP
jgi:putative flippase GtrA